MAESTRAKRFRFLVLAVAVGLAAYIFMPKGPSTSGPVKAASSRKALPEISLPLAGGGDWKLSDHRGKVVLVNFWATWCPPCRRETPELTNVQRKYASRGFTIVGISLDDNPASVVPSFVQQFKINYPILYPTPDFGMASEIQSLPTTLLIDRNGRIARTYVGGISERTISDDIEQVLNEQPSARSAD